jgi:hypothetical protein
MRCVICQTQLVVQIGSVMASGTPQCQVTNLEKQRNTLKHGALTLKFGLGNAMVHWFALMPTAGGMFQRGS